MAENNNTKEKIAAGVGIAALVAATAGAIFLYGTEAGKKKRKQFESWALRMRADVMDQMEKMKEWNEETYHKIIDSVAERYRNVKTADPVEIAALVRDLRSHWRTIKKQIGAGDNKSTSTKKTTKRRTTKPRNRSKTTETTEKAPE